MKEKVSDWILKHCDTYENEGVENLIMTVTWQNMVFYCSSQHLVDVLHKWGNMSNFGK